MPLGRRGGGGVEPPPPLSRAGADTVGLPLPPDQRAEHGQRAQRDAAATGQDQQQRERDAAQGGDPGEQRLDRGDRGPLERAQPAQEQEQGQGAEDEPEHSMSPVAAHTGEQRTTNLQPPIQPKTAQRGRMSAETDSRDRRVPATSDAVAGYRAAVTSLIGQVTHELHALSAPCDLVGCQHHRLAQGVQVRPGAIEKSAAPRRCSC